MSDPRAFISFDVDHNSDEKVLFGGQAKNSKTPFSIQDWSAKSSMPQSQWEAIVKEKINKCNMVIVLVGKYMASATGVVKEIKMAKDQNVPIFGVFIYAFNQIWDFSFFSSNMFLEFKMKMDLGNKVESSLLI